VRPVLLAFAAHYALDLGEAAGPGVDVGGRVERVAHSLIYGDEAPALGGVPVQ